MLSNFWGTNYIESVPGVRKEGRRCLRRDSEAREEAGHLLNGRNRLAVGGSCRLGAPGAYVGIPALVELAAFDVEADLYEIADIEGILINAVAEEVESYLFGVGIGGLEHIYFLFPGVSGF